MDDQLVNLMADLLNVNVGAFGVDQGVMLPRVIRELADAVEVPLCLECRNPEILNAALKVSCGSPIINSVTGEDKALGELLPLVKRYHRAVKTKKS